MNSSNIGKPVFGAARLKTLPLALLLAAGAAHAQDAGGMFAFSGFGTVGATHASTNDGDFVSTLYQPSGAGASRSWDLGATTKAGAQVNAKFTDQLSAVVQVVAMPRTNNTYNPRFEWANLQYAFTPDFKVRVGRTALSSFMVSDTRLVGYANTWVRPPVEMYSAIPMTNMDGVDATYKARFGGVNSTLNVSTGRTDIETIAGDGRKVGGTEIRRARGINNTFEFGAWSVRLGYLRSRVAIQLAPGLHLQVPQKAYTIGAVYDPGAWFVQGEVANTKLPGFAPTTKVGYVTGGYRVGNFTPYAMYAKSSPDNTPAIIAYDQSTTSLGLRWDAMKNTAVKVQVDRVNLPTGSTGFFTNVRPALAGSNVNLVTVAVDFVF
nr:hypothetical protein [uncultured Duganella sp.]